MTTKLFTLLLLASLGSLTYLADVFFKEKVLKFERTIREYDMLIRKTERIKKIDKDIKESFDFENIVDSKNRATRNVISVFDRYKRDYALSVTSLTPKNDSVRAKTVMQRDSLEYYDVKKCIDWLSLNKEGSVFFFTEEFHFDRPRMSIGVKKELIAPYVER
ncbi:hypothetical protein [Nitrosophilus alvini]|uniref:hypothetical protein n=1 Tax=Nitrosophilus alvini TaxID=2714855 RepID=UPI00190A18D5|nr:hypothetical protein [Nitrosophilus alvini]